jgi:LysM repeat protein
MRRRLQHAFYRHRPLAIAAASIVLLGGLGLGLWLTVGPPSNQHPAPLAAEAPAGADDDQAQVPAGVPTVPVASLPTQVNVTPESASPFANIAQPPPAPPKRTSVITHTVAADEVLWQIAEHYNLRTETILWANDLENPDLLLVGQHLTIPPQDGVMYTVRPGDSLADVGVRYGVDVQEVMHLNGLANPDQLQAGVDIFLPGARPLANVPQAPAAEGQAEAPSVELDTAAAGPPVPLPDNIDALLSAGWLSVKHATDLHKFSGPGPVLHQVPPGVRLERLDGYKAGRIEVRDPGDGRTRQAMTGWVSVLDVDVGRAPSTRELPLGYPNDTAMDISHVFAPYRSQLDGSPYAEANCGPTTIGMALDAFGVSVPSRQLRASALDAQHMYGNGAGTLITALAQVVEQQGLSAYDLRDGGGGLHRWSLDEIRAQIQQGHPVVVQVRYRSLPGRGGVAYYGDHYILVTGVVGDGFLYNDPIDVDGLGWDRMINGTALRNAMNASAAGYAYTAFAVGR